MCHSNYTVFWKLSTFPAVDRGMIDQNCNDYYRTSLSESKYLAQHQFYALFKSLSKETQLSHSGWFFGCFFHPKSDHNFFFFKSNHLLVCVCKLLLEGSKRLISSKHSHNPMNWELNKYLIESNRSKTWTSITKAVTFVWRHSYSSGFAQQLSTIK